MANEESTAPRPQRVVVALRRVVEAAMAVETATGGHEAAALARAKCHLRDSARSANDDGASWQEIGDALGMRRGNAYQRFRRHPGPARTPGGDETEWS